MGSTPTDAAALNGSTLASQYFYSVNSSSVSQSSSNGTSTYSGSVSTSGQATLSGTITDTSSNGNGSFSLTAANGTVTNFLVLGSSSDTNNLVIQQYNPTTGTTGSYYVIADAGTQPTGSISFNSSNNYQKPACFLRGTMIETPVGAKPVETLQIGDLVTCADGSVLPITWIGRRSYYGPDYIRPRDVWPVRIEKDAIGPNLPSETLYVSMGHAIVVDHSGPTMIVAEALINGTTIRQIRMGLIEYWHFELERHQAVIANGLPAETFLPMGNRDCFIGQQLGCDPTEDCLRPASRYPVLSSGDTVVAIRNAIIARSDARYKGLMAKTA